MAEKCPQYGHGALPSPGTPYGACYKHVHPVSLAMSPTSPNPTAIATAPAGMGLMATSNPSKFGTVIPSRIFVGGIDFTTTEEDLHKFFSGFGSVRDTKIIRDRADVSKGYGFVTFSSIEEVNKVMEQEECLYLNKKKLNIGPAIRKQQIYLPKDIHVPGPMCSWVVHPGGYASYTNANGITYFLPTPQLQMVPPQQSYVMAYSGNPTQPVTQYGGFTQNAATIQHVPSNVAAIPWTPTQTGSCGQILTPVQAMDHSQTIGMVPLPPTATNGNTASAARTQIAATPSHQGASVIPQGHVQVPTTYVCSPIPGQQPIQMRVAPSLLQAAPEQAIIHPAAGYGQQIAGVVPKSHAQVAANGEIPTIALGEGSVIPAAYGIQPTLYPVSGVMGFSDVNGQHFQYAPMPAHQPGELTPPPTPESQAKKPK